MIPACLTVMEIALITRMLKCSRYLIPSTKALLIVAYSQSSNMWLHFKTTHIDHSVSGLHWHLLNQKSSSLEKCNARVKRKSFYESHWPNCIDNAVIYLMLHIFKHSSTKGCLFWLFIFIFIFFFVLFPFSQRSSRFRKVALDISPISWS